MNTQIEQLRKEIADKQKQLELLQQFPYENGNLVYVESLYEWIIEFDCIKDFEVLILYSYCLSSNSEYKGKSTLCHTDEITTHRLATEADLNRLPDGHKWKPKKLPTTIEEVCEVLDPCFVVTGYGEIKHQPSYFNEPIRINFAATEKDAERLRAYGNLLKVIAWGNQEWPDDNRFIKQCGMPATNSKTLRHIETYFAHDLETFQY